MKTLINKISNTLKFCVALIVLTAAQNGVADNIIYEGESIPGGFYLDMSRDEVNRIGGTYLPYGDEDSRDCRTGSKCTFRSGEDGLNLIRFVFEDDHVVQLEILKLNFGGRDPVEELETSIGATLKMSPEEVAAFYPGSVITDTGSRKQEVVVAQKGYTFKSRLQCPYNSNTQPCVRWGTHRIYKPTNGLVNSFELLNTFLSGNRGSERVYKFTVPEGRKTLKASIYSGTGDADLYVKKGSDPTLQSYHCRPYLKGNRESCRLNLGAGIYYIKVHGYSSYSGLSLKGSSE
ncbi:MAG: PPC domain-containing protein [Methylococcales bacterium]|nr:PPC domain-containing protein [Methylococcales bacterium]